MNVVVRVNSEKEKDVLSDDLLRNYNPILKPSRKNLTNVSITVSLNKILDVDEKKQVIETYLWLYILWNDTRLSWNPKKYDDIDRIRLPLHKIWKPDIIMDNAVDEIPFKFENSFAMVTSKGLCSWYPYGIFRSSCTINIKDFPFDKQTCSFIFESASHDCRELDFTLDGNSNDYVRILEYENSSEWEIESFTVNRYTEMCPRYSYISFDLVLKRKPLFYLINMILPCIITLAVALLAFLVPANTGEKMSIGITTLLSTSVLLLVVSNDLPPNSDQIPVIAIFYCTSTFLILLVCIASVFTLNIHYNGDNGDVPERLKIFFTKFGNIIMFPKTIHFKHNEIAQLHGGTGTSYNKVSVDHSSRGQDKCKVCERKRIRLANSSLNGIRIYLNTKEHVDSIKKNWEQLASIIDRFLFYMFIIITGVSLWCIFYK